MNRPGMTAKSKEAVDQRLIKALGHPVRMRALQVLNTRVASPSELAKELDEPLGNIAYHVKILEENDAIELVRTAPVRGALEHFYRAMIRPWFEDDSWARLPASVRRELFNDILQDAWGEVVAAAEEQGLDDPRTHITRTWLDLDDKAYGEVVDLLNSVVDRALELHAEAAPRLAKLSPEERDLHPTALMIMHVHRAPGGPASGRRRLEGNGPREAKSAT
jgi:DNA-binding transcriptional ArsR family regulator